MKQLPVNCKLLYPLYLALFGTWAAAAFGFNSYLDSLSAGSAPRTPPTPAITEATPTASSASSASSASTTAAVTHAPLSYFALDQLTSKGPPRASADWGTPHEATRKLADDGVLQGGSWWCSRGGWPSPNEKAHTEVFYVCLGHGCISDAADGMRHYFGPGDTVIIPKGHQGRWDVNEDIHKVWAVNDHPNIEEPRSNENPIRVKVIHYQDYHTNTASPTGFPSLQPPPQQRLLYDVGPTRVGIWICTDLSTRTVAATRRLWFLLLKGSLVVLGQDGTSQQCHPGDTVMLPHRWSGTAQILEPVKILWVEAD